jgi:septal ring factor EnvC (AmiA/AmiB activator)
MKTKWLLVLILLLALVSTLSSAAALFLVTEEKSDYKRLEERMLSIEAGLANSNQPVRRQDAQAEELSATLNLIFQRLSDHEQSLDKSVRELSNRMTPFTPRN